MENLNKFNELSEKELEDVTGGVDVNVKDLGSRAASLLAMFGVTQETLTLTPQTIDANWATVQTYLKSAPMLLPMIDQTALTGIVNELYAEYESSPDYTMPEELDKILSPYRTV